MLDTWALDEGLVDLEGMVSMHLSTNFYPVFDHEWIKAVTPAVMEAIVNCADDMPEEQVFWPDIDPVPAGAVQWSYGITVSSARLVEVTKTWPIVQNLMDKEFDL